jgi:hypothetical protein
LKVNGVFEKKLKNFFSTKKALESRAQTGIKIYGRVFRASGPRYTALHSYKYIEPFRAGHP